jgi:type IV secretory pathway VirB2 component (pilin)
MKKFISILLVAVYLLGGSFFLVPTPVHAQLEATLGDDLTSIGEASGLDSAGGGEGLPDMVGRIIKVVLGLLGVVLVVIIVYAGFLWMTAGGDEKKVKDAKAWMTNAIIGLVIIVAAYAITDFVINKLLFVVEG